MSYDPNGQASKGVSCGDLKEQLILLLIKYFQSSKENAIFHY